MNVEALGTSVTSNLASGQIVAILLWIVNGGDKVDHMGGSIVGLRLSTFRGNVRLSVQQKCHLSNPGSYQMSTAPVVRLADALDRSCPVDSLWHEKRRVS